MHKKILSTGTAQLATRVCEPEGAPAHASVVIGGAMGVRQDYYAPFSEWLSSQGFRVTTFDYRGSGDSLPDTADGRLRGFQADLMDWASDYETVVDSAKAALPGAPLYLLGHSLGAQLPGCLKNQSISDDELMTWRGTQNLINLYTSAPRSFERITPADLSVKRIGHFGFFRQQFSQNLWPRAVQVFERMRTTPAASSVASTTA